MIQESTQETPVKASRIYLGLTSPNAPNAQSDILEREAWIYKKAEAFFPQGCSIYQGMGIWKSDQEPVLIVEIIHDDPNEAAHLARFAVLYKDFARQEAVMFCEQQLDVVMF